VLAAIPVIPFGIVSGVIGAKFGLAAGTLINIGASTTAAVLVYLLFRYLLSQQGEKWLARHRSLHNADAMIKRHAFWALLIARMIPVLPAALINIYSGVFGLPFKLFFITTLLGKIPVMLAFTFVGNSIGSGSMKWLLAAIIYVAFLLIVYRIYRHLMK